MAISKDKVRVELSIHKEALECITKFAEFLKISKSEFVESVCVQFIQDVVARSEEKRKETK